ncbi:MAG: T9SS type A sorting domain-containing protein [Crocinitomicaceae bacterium]|nr:T9SS type A sorting domain-containing protein [Crocinitomicaceae bacterium]MBK8925406.1 T9SS type A sorting domain-containing protein [Crocinitomicaceae bacterium]
MKKILFLICFVLVTQFSFAQDNELIWAQGRGSSDTEITRDLIVDGSGNIISVGQFSNTIDFDNGTGTHSLTSNGNFDIFVMKQDPDGNLLWAHNFGDYYYDVGYSVGVDNANNIYITGLFSYEVDFDPSANVYNVGSSGSSLYQIFLLKLNSDGEFEWINHLESVTGHCQGLDIAVEYTGASVITGNFIGPVDFDPSVGTANMTAVNSLGDIFIARYDNAGGYQWAHQLSGTSGNNFPGDVSIGFDYSVYLSGTFGGTMDLDPTAGTQSAVSNGYDDSFVLKLMSDGTFLWAKSFGGIWGESATAIISKNADFDVYIGGSFRQDVDFDPGAGIQMHSAGTSEYSYLLKLDWSGEYVWVKTFVDGNNKIEALALDEDQYIYSTGGFSNTPDFDPGAGVVNKTSHGNNDIFVVQLDGSGNFLWANSYGSINEDGANAIYFNAQEDYYIGGQFSDGADFSSSLTPFVLTAQGGIDSYVAKYGPCSYNLDLTVTQSGITLSAVQNGANYQWLNCGTMTEVLGATSQNFTPTSDGDYACKIMYGSCVDTSTCTTISGVGIDEGNASNIIITPNPATENIQIKTDVQVELISIFNANGQLILTTTEQIISVNELPSGIYYVVISSADNTWQSRFIKN